MIEGQGIGMQVAQESHGENRVGEQENIQRWCVGKRRGQFMLVMAQWERQTRILLLSGRFDKNARVPMATAIAASEGQRCNQVMLDCSNVSSMDSAGIGKLLLLYHSLRRKGIGLSVRNPRTSVEELLHLVHLSTLIPIVKSKGTVRSVA